MLNDFELDAKSIYLLSTKGLSLDALKPQLKESLKFSLEMWSARGLNIIKKKDISFLKRGLSP